MVRIGREVERRVLAQAVRWHLEDRVLVMESAQSSLNDHDFGRQECQSSCCASRYYREGGKAPDWRSAAPATMILTNETEGRLS